MENIKVTRQQQQQQQEAGEVKIYATIPLTSRHTGTCIHKTE